MSLENDIDDITAKLQDLDIEQQTELNNLIHKHRRQKSILLEKLRRASTGSTTKEPVTPPQILSDSDLPLQRGDRVVIRTKASIGRKGDVATVLKVAPKRVDIYVPRLNDKTWRLLRNLSHHQHPSTK